MSLLKYVFFYRQPIHSNEDVQYIKSECITLCPPSTSSTEVTILTFRGCCCHQDEAYLWTNSLILIFSSFVLLSVLTVSLHLRSKSSFEKERDCAHIYNATPNGSPTQWSVTVKMDYRAESSQTLSRVCCADADVKPLTNTTATAPESLQRFRFWDCQPNFSVSEACKHKWNITLFLGPYSGFTVKEQDGFFLTKLLKRNN